ncbi:MAG: helix-turn-helix domain-containing protein [Leptolyngbya sp. UWPOB_LEPTO1]|uniref:helix-turn-helix domain-containing protein n=1 Tax=Leptolyngbya sp. UWPOB_LEPTO1 TaxID=2815653 RepID=UPI001AC073E8|nr:helix-turn-helix domain-containing protein [Leptolyngbya sp. UWPOB_LEPTO1]MBN8564898.1 helix-turn-helix domain-containing protein [Leptolyngbya sp. UWPOB_LEPTO1]
MSGRDKRPKIQRDRDRATVAELRLKGWTQQQIADYLELDQSTISRDLKVLELQWKESALRDFDLDRAMTLEKLRLAEKEYWDAWLRSQQSKETSIREQLRNAIASEEGTTAGSGRIKLSTKTEQKTGEAVFLNGVIKCVELQAKLLGLFPEGATNIGGSIQLNESQLNTIAALMGEKADVSDS